MNYHLDLVIALSDDKAGQDRSLTHLENTKPSCVEKVSTAKKFHRHVRLARLEASRRNMDNLVDGEQTLDCPKQPNALPIVVFAILEVLPTDFAFLSPARAPGSGSGASITASINLVAAPGENRSYELAETEIVAGNQYHSLALIESAAQMGFTFQDDPLTVPVLPVAPEYFEVFI